MPTLLNQLPNLLVLALCGLALVLAGPSLVRSASSGNGTLSIAALWVLALGPTIQFLADPLGTGPTATRASQGASILIYALGALAVLGSIRPKASQSTRWPVAALLGYSFTLIASALFNDQFALNLLILPVSAFVVARSGNLSMDRLIRHLRWITRTILLLSLYLAATRYAEAAFTDNGRTMFGYTQLAGATPHPNVLGPLAGMAVMFELAPERRRSWVWVLPALTCCALAQSRTGWVMAALAVIMLMYRRGSGVKAANLIPLAWGGFLVLTLAATVKSIRSPMAQLFEVEWLNGRDEVWLLALQPFRDSPLFGGGPSAYNEEFRASFGTGLGSIVGQAHNQGIQTLATAGVVGGAALLLVLVIWARTSNRAWRAGSYLPTASAVVLLAWALVEAPMRGYVVHSTFLVLAVMLALLCAAPSPDLATDPAPVKDEPARAPSRQT